MVEIFRKYAEYDSMILWNPYLLVSYFPSKTTGTGIHSQKLGISVGRRIKPPEKIKEIDKETLNKILPKDVSREIQSKYLHEVGVLPEVNLRNRLTNYLLRGYKKLNKSFIRTLGVDVSFKPEGQVEVYQFMKFTKTSHYLPLFKGLSLGLGVLMHMQNYDINKINRLTFRVLKDIKKNIPEGYKMARKEGWK